MCCDMVRLQDKYRSPFKAGQWLPLRWAIVRLEGSGLSPLKVDHHLPLRRTKSSLKGLFVFLEGTFLVPSRKIYYPSLKSPNNYHYDQLHSR